MQEACSRQRRPVQPVMGKVAASLVRKDGRIIVHFVSSLSVSKATAIPSVEEPPF